MYCVQVTIKGKSVVKEYDTIDDALDLLAWMRTNNWIDGPMLLKLIEKIKDFAKKKKFANGEELIEIDNNTGIMYKIWDSDAIVSLD